MFDTGLKNAVLGQYNLDRYDFYLISKGYISKTLFQSKAKCEATDLKVIFFILMAILFFSPFSVVRPIQIFGIYQKKSNAVVEPFFTWNNSFNLKNEHSNSIEKNRNIFYSILCILLIQICEC